ncbi:DUS2 [Symbiodinium sp. CCMP2592]|nr:DUS2 [Symbiodinium sp. CCMP2592]
MIFFRAGHFFSATIIFVGVGMQISMRWISSFSQPPCKAASEAYLSLLVGIFGLVTVPLDGSLDMCFLLVSVLFSLTSVKTGVSMSAEMLAAEEEVPCRHDETVPDFYKRKSRKSFAAQRSLHVVQQRRDDVEGVLLRFQSEVLEV